MQLKSAVRALSPVEAGADHSVDEFIFELPQVGDRAAVFGLDSPTEADAGPGRSADAPGRAVTTVELEDYEAKPDNPGGGNGGGGGGGGNGGGGGGGKGGGKPKDPPADDVLTVYLSGDDAVDDSLEYNIEIEFLGTWTAALQEAFIKSADFLSLIILGDEADILSGPYATDDITITAELVDIDGSGGVLGRAGPTVVRTADSLPVAALMEFDIADAEDFDALGLFDDIVLHEMVHSLGFGTIWDALGLTTGTIGSGDLVFTGTNANHYYGIEFGGSGGIPVEEDGGPGTAGGHWDDETFGNEIMTGYISDPNYMSEMTVGALEDMGYDTYLDDITVAGDLTGSVDLGAFWA